MEQWGYVLILVSVAITLVSSTSKPPQCKENQFALHYSNNPSSVPVTTPKNEEPLKALTVCFWIKTLRTDYFNVFSYSTGEDEVYMSMKLNEFKFNIYGTKVKMDFKEEVLKDTLTSVCMTWDKECTLYKNSMFQDKTILYASRKILPHGTLKLGKGHDHAFEGDISHFNMWSYVLPMEIIAMVSHRCWTERGDVISWDAFKDGVSSGNVQVVKDICPNTVPESIPSNLLGHWPLDGPSKNISLNYSAAYLEGRYKRTRSLFLDGTAAHAEMPSFNLTGDFTIALWLKYTPSNEPREATILSNWKSGAKEIILKIDRANEILFQRAVRDSSKSVFISEDLLNITSDEWHHVAIVWNNEVSSSKCQIFVYIDGREHESNKEEQKSWNQTHSETWDIGGTAYGTEYQYFLGYISDLMVFNKVLSNEEIGKVMGVGIKRFSTEWTPRLPLSGNPSGLQTRLETSPDGASCVNERIFTPGDCLGVLLSQNQSTTRVNISVNDNFIPVVCDQSTNGGGWLIIGRKISTNFDFNRSNEEYAEGFGQNDGSFWLGSKTIAAITKTSVQLLIEIQREHGQSYASYRYFRMEINKESETTGLIAYYTGNAGDFLFAEGSTNEMLLEKIKNLFNNSTLKTVEMKTRPNTDLPSDYTLYFKSPRPVYDQVKVYNLTEISSFTVCLWIRVSKPHEGTLLSLVSEGSSCKLMLSLIGNSYYLNASCFNNEAKDVFTSFDDAWHHVCFSRRGSSGLIMLYLDGMREAESYITNDTHVIPRGGILNIGRYQTSRYDSSVASDFIGQLGHVDMWDYQLQESTILVYAKGPGSESGNVVSWGVIRALVSGGISVIHPSSLSLKESYHWRFANGNDTVQIDDNVNSTAVINGTIVNAEEESLIIEKQGFFKASDVKQKDSLTISFWIKQQVLISNILGDNVDYYTQLRKWLSPIVSHHASWIRCYSSKKDGWLVSTFHNNCDFKGPTVTLIRVKDNVFGGMIDQNWGGAASSLSSTKAFLFTLNNPHGIPPSMFPIKKDDISHNYTTITAAQTNPFLGPSFGSNDLAVYEDSNGHVGCYSDLGNSYEVSSYISNKTGNNIFTGSRWFYPDEIEVFYYDFSLVNVSFKTVTTSSSISEVNGMYCSNANTVDEYIVIEFKDLEIITHIGIQGEPDKHVTSFGVQYYTALKEKVAKWITLTTVFVSKNGGRQTLHALVPPIQAIKVRIHPISWSGKMCMHIEIFTYTKVCGVPFGMQDGKIPDERVSASSTYITYKSDDNVDRNRWPMRGRLNEEPTGWVQAYGNGGNEDWFQVDLETPQDIRCIALQGIKNKIQFVKKYKISYSDDGLQWDFTETDYNTNIYNGVADGDLILLNPTARAVKARFIRLHTSKCYTGKTCGLRMEIYGNKRDLGIVMPGLQFFARRGSNLVIYSTPTQSWKIESQPKIANWTHVTITWSSINGLRMYYNGSSSNLNTLASNLVGSMQSNPVIAIGMTGDDGLGNKPMKLSQLKVWRQELNERDILEDFQSIICSFENGMCWASLQDSNVVSSWDRILYCLADNNTGVCQDGSVTGYCLTLRSSTVSFGQASVFTSPLLHSAYSCVSFSFRISGNKHVGRLNINLIDSQGNRILLWRRGGNHGKMWTEAKVPVRQTKPFKIEFEGIKGRDYGSYIAIDNITISVQTCETLIPANAHPDILAIKSSILARSPTRMQGLRNVLVQQGLNSTSWSTCYASRQHGWKVNTFHSLCDMKGPTILLARSKNEVFGGATEQSWGQVFSDSDAYSLRFTSSDEHNNVLLKIPRDMRALTLSFWIKTSVKTKMEIASLLNGYFSLKYDASGSGITVRMFLNSSSYSTQSLSDNVWHHIGVQWDNINGTCTILIDGSRKKQETFDNSKAKIIPAGSSFVLGKSRFIGFLDHVNLWSRVIGEIMVKLLSQGSHSYHGDALAWPAFRNGIQGHVTIVSSRCEPNKSANNYEIIFKRAPHHHFILLDSPWKSRLEEFTMSWWMKTESKEDQYLLSYVESSCSGKPTLSINLIFERSLNRWQFLFKFVRPCNTSIERRLNLTAPLNDGYWHHVAATWSASKEFICLHVDGRLEKQIVEDIPDLPAGGKIILGQLSINLNGDLNAVQIYEGKLSGFNMWDYVMDHEAISVLAVSCGAESGNLLKWANVQNGVADHSNIISPSSCPNGHYRPDIRAFLFALDVADVNASTVTRVRKEQAEVATRDYQSNGPVFGDAPHDLIVGDNGIMDVAFYNQNVSYDAQILAKGNFSLDEVEVFYRKATLCSSTCLYKHSCDEINGGCVCDTADTSFGLCSIDQLYRNAIHYWPLDHPKAIDDLRSEDWGTAGDDITSCYGVNGDALRSNGLPGSYIKLGSYNTTCLASTCTISIVLWLKYWPSAISGHNQTFLNIQGIFTLFQPENPTQLGIMVFLKNNYRCNYVFNATAHIWNQIFVTTNAAEKVIIYKNGLLVSDFVKSDCGFQVNPNTNGLVTLSKDGAVAEYDDLVIWNTALSEIQIRDIFNSYTEKSLIPITFTARLSQETWYEDLLNPDSEKYHDLFKRIQSNVLNLYAGLNVSLRVLGFRKGSVISKFTISYYPWSPDLVSSLQNNVTSSSRINNMPSEILEVSASQVPSSPINVQAVATSISTIDVTWTAPVMDNITQSLLQGYYVYLHQSGVPVPTRLIVEAPKTMVKLSNLPAHTGFQVWVSGYTIKGEGISSNIVNITISPPTEKPVITAAYNTSTTSIFVKWDKLSSSHNQTNVVAYEVLIYRNDSRSKPVCVMMVNCENATITRLERYTAYEILVAGVTKGGKGPYSDPIVCMTDEDVPEGSPSNITLVDATSTSLNIKWLPIPITKRYGIIVGYTVVYYSLDEGNQVVFNQTCTQCDLRMNVTNLKPFRKYRLEILGFTSKGNGPTTNTSTTFETLQAAPSAGPELNSAVNLSSTSLLIKWTPIPKQSVNGIIKAYVVSYQAAGSSSSSPLSKKIDVDQSSVLRRRRRRAIDNRNPQVTLDGLDKFMLYTVKVAGFTVAQGPFGPSINVTTDEDVPDMPLLLEAKNTSSTTIFVTWQPPARPNGVILGYVVSYSEVDSYAVPGSENVSSKSVTLSGLTNYTTYIIRVAGYTSKGIGSFNSTTCTTDEAVPTGPPQAVSALAASTTSIEVKWKQVAMIQRRGIITHYEVQIHHFSNKSLVDNRTIPGNQYTTTFEGLGKLSNYTVRMNAHTRKGPGPFSDDVFATTGVKAPEIPPGNVSAQTNGTDQILVKWSNLELHIDGVLRGYRIMYTETSHPFSTVRNVTVDNTKQEVLLTGLYYYTKYRIRVAGFTTSDGNYSEPVYATTGEGVPGRPPSEIVLSNRGSREIGLFWYDVDPAYRNGEVIKYRAQYRKTGPVERPFLVKEVEGYSMVLPNLERSTDYEIRISAGTSVGYGNSSIHFIKTDEDVPSQAPLNLTAQNWTSLYSLPVTWEPIPQEYMHGILTNYYLNYFTVKQGDKDVLKTKVIEVILPASQTWYNITGLLPLSVYRIEVAASTKKGTGPISITFGETCRCQKKFSTNWSQYKPYSNVSNDGRPGYIIPIMIQQMVSYCCGYCKEHGKSEVDFHSDGQGNKAEKKSLQELLQAIDGQTDFSFPVYGYQDQTMFKGGLGYTPLIQSPGVAFITGKDSYDFKEQMFQGILGCWPVLAIPIVMACIAGFFVWFLDCMSNPKSDFPTPFVKGFKEGIWWSFVSMTTVGYGDRIPKTYAGRIFSVCWTLTGIVIISVATSTLTTTLTEITIKGEKRLYGAQVAALQDGPEYLLGKRRNAYVNEKNKYYTLDELTEALHNREVNGILVDTYAAGSRTDLFNDPSLRVAKVLDYKMAYGLVTAGNAIKLRWCFRDFLNVNKVDIYFSIVNNVRQIEYRKYDPSKTVSTGLFDPDASFFKASVKYTLVMFFVLLVAGICYECVRRLRLRARIDDQEILKMMKSKKEEMKGIVQEFKQNVDKVSKELTAKHRKEISYLKKMKKKARKSFGNYGQDILMKSLTQKDVCL